MPASSSGRDWSAMNFCTCTDLKCPYHPSNHSQGCTLCIQKNLRLKEIPSCFFNDIDYPKPTKGWHYEDFAALVNAAGADDNGEDQGSDL